MNHLHSYAHLTTGVLDPEGMLSGFGSLALAAACAILFIECGLLVGVILPGDSLLFIVGMLLSSKFIATPLLIALIAMIASAIIGNLVGYWVGERVGPRLFRRPDSKFFKHEYVERTREFFDRHGSRAIVLARFVPIVRSIITAMAGIGKMDFKRYATFSTIGGIAWVASMTLSGYYLGNISVIKDNIEAVTILIVLLSVIPVGVEYLRNKKS